MLNKKGLTLTALICFFLAGCASSKSVPITGPNGKQGLIVDCSSQNDFSVCYKEASDLCGGKGYSILSKTDKDSTFFSSSQRKLTIECK